MPALLQSTWTAPKRSSVVCGQRLDLLELGDVAALRRWPRRRRPAARRRWRRAWSGSRSATTTFMPAPAKARHMPRPMPLAPPVTTATRPVTSCMSPPRCSARRTAARPDPADATVAGRSRARPGRGHVTAARPAARRSESASWRERHGDDRGRRSVHRLRARRAGAAARPPPRLRGRRPDDLATAARRVWGATARSWHGTRPAPVGPPILPTGSAWPATPTAWPASSGSWASNGPTWPGCRSVARWRSPSPTATRPCPGR